MCHPNKVKDELSFCSGSAIGNHLGLHHVGLPSVSSAMLAFGTFPSCSLWGFEYLLSMLKCWTLALSSILGWVSHWRGPHLPAPGAVWRAGAVIPPAQPFPPAHRQLLPSGLSWFLDSDFTLTLRQTGRKWVPNGPIKHYSLSLADQKSFVATKF